MVDFSVFGLGPFHRRVSVGNYLCEVNGSEHPRGGQTELYLSPTHSAHTSLCWYGEGAKCVGERWREGSIEQRKSAVNHERRQKPPVFPQCTRLSASLGATVQRCLPPTLSHTRTNTCIHSPGSSGVIKTKKTQTKHHVHRKYQ